MRSAILTNTAVGASNGVTNPQAATASANLSASTQAAAQTSQIAAANSGKVLASERTVSIEKKTEGSFDPQKNDTEREAGELQEQSARSDSEPGRLLAVA